jgi:hypothetical protein
MKFRPPPLIAAFFGILLLVFAGCSNPFMDQLYRRGREVPGTNLASKLAWLKKNALSNSEYWVTVGENENIGG